MAAQQRNLSVDGFSIGNKLPFVLIAGPCAIESGEHALETAAELKEITSSRNIPLIYKSSFDKANRTSSRSSRGIGLTKGLPILSEVKKNYWLSCHY